MGNFDDLFSASSFVKNIEELDREKIAFVRTYRCSQCGLLKFYADFETES